MNLIKLKYYMSFNRNTYDISVVLPDQIDLPPDAVQYILA